MADPRFFVPQLPDAGVIELPPSESKHAAQVLRLSAGQRIVLFDGKGGEALASIQATGARRTVVAIERRTYIDRELPIELNLLVALPKGERQRTLVEGLTQLGVTRLIPLLTARSVARPTQNALERLRRYVIESCKQCARTTLMEIAEPCDLFSLLQLTAEPDDVRIFAHPHDKPHSWSGLLAILDDRRSPQLRSFQLMIGPEGGFTAEESNHLLAAHWLPLSLGCRMLRVEMAAITSAAALIATQAGEQT